MYFCAASCNSRVRHIFMKQQNQSPEVSENQATPTEGVTEKTECLSAGATLFWRIFVPIFGTVFLTGLLLTFWLIPGEDLYLPFPVLWGRLFVLALWLLWLLLVRQTLWKLKRIDANGTHLYVTNYWITARYPWTEVESIVESRRLGRLITTFNLRAAGRFGRKISFLPSDRFDRWLEENGLSVSNS